MYPRSFRYIRPETLDEALDVFRELGDGARALAGGMSLIPRMKYREVSPDLLVDLAELSELEGVTSQTDSIEIGALVRHADATSVTGHVQGLPEAVLDVAPLIGDAQVRNMGTIGGSLAAVEPTSDWGPVLLALDGRVHVRSAAGHREIAATELFLGYFSTSLEPEELLLTVDFRRSTPTEGSAHVKFQTRPGAPLVSASAWVDVDDDGLRAARIAVGGVTAIPVRLSALEDALVGQQLTHGVLEEAYQDHAETLESYTDGRTTAAHRRALAGSCIQVAVTRAMDRCNAGDPSPATSTRS